MEGAFSSVDTTTKTTAKTTVEAQASEPLSTPRKSVLGLIYKHLNTFFFAEETPYGMALMRICLPFTILLTLLPRWFHARELYSADGAPAPLSLLYLQPNFLPEFSGFVIVAAFTALIFFAVASCLGWMTRFSLMAMLVLYFYFGMMDGISTITKYSVIACHGLLLLSLSECGSIWSIDAWLKKRKNPSASTKMPRSPIWTQRLVQIFIGVVYLGAAMTKVHTQTYFNGDQLKFWMATHMNNGHPLGELLMTTPSILVAMGYIALVWEFTFIFTVWSGWKRIVMLTLGVLFHTATAFTLGLFIFPLVCFSIYLAFMSEADFHWIGKQLSRFRILQPATRIHQLLSNTASRVMGRASLVPIPAIAGFALVLLTFVAVGVQTEYAMDPYGIRGENGPHTLKPMDEKLANVLLTPMPKLRETDKVFSFDLGYTLVGGNVLETTDTFQQGDSIIAQVSLNPPHGDMYIECILYDNAGNVIDEVGQLAQRHDFRSNFRFNFCEAMEPGKYRFLLRVNGSPVEQQHFSLIKGKASHQALAN